MTGPTVNIHATCLRLARAGSPFGAPPNCGVLLLGPSGSGKSDLALRLIAAGAELVADDRTDLFVRGGRLFARTPARIAGLLEVRAVGILALPYTRQVAVTLVVRLGRPGARLPAHKAWKAPAALRLPSKAAPPVISLAPFEASAPAKLAVAVAAAARGLYREDVNPI
jgi:HPr kinase/phosphorylase